jgi:hypothetical protein
MLPAGSIVYRLQKEQDCDMDWSELAGFVISQD